MPKRKFDDVLRDAKNLSKAATSAPPAPVKNSLDSDEEDDDINEDHYNVLEEDDIEGIEDAPLPSEAKIGFTAFNLKEELEDGHFDKEGHYVWKKEKEIKDHWLDNIDSVPIKLKKPGEESEKTEEKERGLGDTDSEDDDDIFDPTELFKKILPFLQPGETITKALGRLGKGRAKISSAERWKRKKAGLAETDEKAETIIQLTALANELLTKTGNLDIYDESFETISRKLTGEDDRINKEDALLQ